MRALFILILFMATLFAHKLNIFVYQENDSLTLNAYFASGAACQNCSVQVKQETTGFNKTGVTNTKGDFVFQITKSEPLHIVVDAGAGHMHEKSFVPKTFKEVNNSSALVEALQKENAQLKKEIALLKEKNSLSDMAKMFLGLILIALLFVFLKRVTK